MPICWPSSPITRISRARIRSFVRIKRLSIRTSVRFQRRGIPKYTMPDVSIQHSALSNQPLVIWLNSISSLEATINDGRVATDRKYEKQHKNYVSPIKSVKPEPSINNHECKHSEHENIDQEDHKHRAERLLFKQANVPAPI